MKVGLLIHPILTNSFEENSSRYLGKGTANIKDKRKL